MDSRAFISPDQARSYKNAQFAEVARAIALGMPVARNSNARLVYDGAMKYRAGVPASGLGTEDDVGLAAYGSVNVAFLEELRSISAFDAMLPFMQNAPMLSKIAITTAGFVASEEDQGIGIPLGSMAFGAPGALAPRKVLVIAASSDETLRFSDGAKIFNAALQRAVVAGVDKSFCNDIIAENSTIASSGALADIVALLAAVKLEASSKPFLIMSPTRRKKAIGLDNTAGFPMFPDLDLLVNGGSSKIRSIPVLATDSIADSAMILADAFSIFAAGTDPVELEQSSEADVQMADAVTIASRSGSPPEPTPTTIVNLFMTGGKAIRCLRQFSYRITRSDAVASISGISW